MGLLTGVASVLPFETFNHIKVGALSRERPTVMQCPHNGDFIFFDKPEQERKIYIAIMKIVKLN